MKKIIDVTFDLESLSLASNAAVFQVAAVAFNRHAVDVNDVFPSNISPFEAKVDIRSCVSDGFDFSPSTVKWWSEKSDEVKADVLTGDSYPLREVMEAFIQWLNDLLIVTKVDVLCLWAQGADFDISVLRTILRKYNMESKFPVHYHNFRDARTFIAEIGAYYIAEIADNDGLADHELIYDALPPLPEKGNVHNATYDCRRTSWTLWQCFSLLPDPS